MRDGVWLDRAHPVRVTLDLLARGEAAATMHRAHGHLGTETGSAAA